ncbi:unnamed protein product [Heligmosomoides polygyrus]|uniref:Uncharacterized protein n=1 Tax=Heligmosomoides polygyrus TaxID=6339 RepID=A0A183GCM9_HELPZ|nr:unnamed protein product [Heligmosomoides polygyrus]
MEPHNPTGTSEEARQGVDERWREVLQVFVSDPVRIECATIVHRRDGVSDLGREVRVDDASILRKMASGQVDLAIKEIKVEVVVDLLHCPSGAGFINN